MQQVMVMRRHDTDWQNGSRRGIGAAVAFAGTLALGGMLTLSGALSAGCGATSDTANGGSGGSGASQSTTTGGAGGATGGAGGAGPGAGGLMNTGGMGTGGFEECAKETAVGNFTPVDLVIMLDQSGSMDSPVGNTTIWGLVTQALTDFVQGQGTDGLSVGLQYFPLPAGACVSCDNCFLPDLQVTDTTTNTCCCSPPTGETCALADGASCPGGGICFQGNCYSGGANATCEAADYADLEVSVGPLPGNATPIVTSLSAHAPKGLTPTGPALSGAIAAAVAQAQAVPDHTVAVVLASDGVPTECSPQDVSQIANIAAAAAGSNPKVRTFVIGIGDVAALNAIAAAGGTTKAFLVSANGNAGQQFLDAMLEIKGSLLSCEFEVPTPASGELDYDLVNVQYTPDGGTAEVVPRVKDEADCGNAPGWYYDDPAAPKKIILCPQTCDQVKSSAKGSVEIVLGCSTVVK